MLRAGIDIGTNTILLLIAKIEEKNIDVLEDKVTVVRLGEGVDQHRTFQPQAMERATACLENYKTILSQYDNMEIRVAATSGSREASNASDFFQKMEKILGTPIRIITGEEEAQYSFYGALTNPEAQGNYGVVDIGGGSTEIITLDSQQKLLRKSFDVGCVRLTERFFSHDPPTEKEVQELYHYVQELFYKEKDFFEKFHNKQWLGVAGTATYVASSILELSTFEPDKVQGTSFDLVQLHKLIQRFSSMSANSRLGVGGMDKGRADVILAGAIILQLCLEAGKQTSIEVSTRGLRYGLVLDTSKE